MRHLWDYTSEAWARKFYKRWYFWATHSRLPEVVKVATMIHSHLDNIMSFFRHRITNAIAEGLNSKIATIQKRAYGYRNLDNLMIAIYFQCGGLQLRPARVTHREV